jgi:NADH:ubiquinone reductase (H+-translocating)
MDKDYWMVEHEKSHVVVLGAGFGGLTFCQHFRHPAARITVVDRTNHHLFQPLLYQVATAGLSAPEIAQPIRSILSRRPDITVLMEEVVDINLTNRQVVLEKSTLQFNYLVLALGGRTSYFGHPEWEQFAPGLKTLSDALHIRSGVLLAFEKAEASADPAEREALLTIVIVGGGPTGVELAGAFAELARTVLKRDFRRIDPTQARIMLVEAAPSVLGHLPLDLSLSARRQLERLGVQVRTETKVSAIEPGKLTFASGECIRAENIIWAAGVAAAPLTTRLGVDLDRSGRVKVNPDLSLPGHPEVFAVGDLALVLQENGQPVPGVSPAAMQMARHVARIIKAELDLAATRRSDVPFPLTPTLSPGEREQSSTDRDRLPDGQRLPAPATGLPLPRGEGWGEGELNRFGSGERYTPRRPFRYWDRGTMATIGRSAAVAWIGRLHFSGFLAWLTWLLVHLVFLIGFRNRLAVLLQWAYSYFAYKRGARIITGQQQEIGTRLHDCESTSIR